MLFLLVLLVVVAAAAALLIGMILSCCVAEVFRSEHFLDDMAALFLLLEGLLCPVAFFLLRQNELDALFGF